MNKENIEEIILTSHEVIQILGISKARLSQLKKSGKLTPIKKNLYFLKDVQNRQNMQLTLREKYLRPKKKIQ